MPCSCSCCRKPLGPQSHGPPPIWARIGLVTSMELELPPLPSPPSPFFPQVRIAAAIKLETPPEEMFTYVQTWKLAPFLDDGLRDSLLALKCDE